MPAFLMLIAFLLPGVGGLLLQLPKLKKGLPFYVVTSAVTLATSVLTWLLILFGSDESFLVISFTDQLEFSFRLDRLGRVFAGIAATLWPFSVLYGFSYMKEDAHKNTFFMYYLFSYGVTLGIAMAENLFTLYCFYELLTLATVPLVMHTRTKEAIRAARLYFSLSIGGAAFAFISIVFLIVGGNMTESAGVIRFFYLLGFFGFSVKAAVFPLHLWLPRAAVAPTPVTALLHAVAVVKAGAFAVIRLTYTGYGIEILKGSFAQIIPLCFVLFTILFGAVMAVREPHVKRRFAYSTVSNLSYILFGVLLMTEEGLTAGLTHMAFHANIKIVSFFCAGAVLHVSGREYLEEYNGLAQRMPVTFACLLVSALALVGIPPLNGFVSKFALLSAALETGGVLAYIGFGLILFAAFLTAIYMLTPLRRAFFPGKNADLSGLNKVHEAPLPMLITMVVLSAAILVTGLLAGRIMNALGLAAAELLQLQ